MNKTHPYWTFQNDSLYQGYMRLDGTFVEKCLWMPKPHILGARKLLIYRPLPTSLVGDPMDVYLERDGGIEFVTYELQITLSCLMDFRKYPFDEQVRLIS